jgi:predicted  nucleic acid-binding Zn-ribbon protein|tara:strand:+ start:251 stop:490 length:240 start_codon:yes stop_codon:yes gene_type:complete
MEMSTYLVWNVFITLVLAPLLFSIRQNSSEIKRIAILVNKTREELPKYYATKEELRDDIQQILDRFDKLEEKLDKVLVK